jgi:hypothetical protein
MTQYRHKATRGTVSVELWDGDMERMAAFFGEGAYVGSAGEAILGGGVGVLFTAVGETAHLWLRQEQTWSEVRVGDAVGKHVKTKPQRFYVITATALAQQYDLLPDVDPMVWEPWEPMQPMEISPAMEAARRGGIRWGPAEGWPTTTTTTTSSGIDIRTRKEQEELWARYRREGRK